jgi:hypothetical protein
LVDERRECGAGELAAAAARVRRGDVRERGRRRRPARLRGRGWAGSTLADGRRGGSRGLQCRLDLEVATVHGRGGERQARSGLASVLGGVEGLRLEESVMSGLHPWRMERNYSYEF